MSFTWPRRLSRIVFLCAFSTPTPALANATIEQYFLQVSDYQFEKLTELSGTEGQAGIGPFSPALLDEYLLLSYSRWSVRSQGLSQPPSLELEIYEMQDAVGAFGMFSIWQSLLEEASQERLNLPVDNYYSGGSLTLWRGHYFLRFREPDPAQNSKQALRNFAHTLVEAIPLLNIHPVTLIHLPKEGLIHKSIRFYLGKSAFALNPHFPEGLSAQLGFEKDIEVTFGQYAPNGHSLFLIGYPTPALAVDYFVKLQNALQTYFSPEGVYMKRAGVMISIFFGPEPRARQILDKVHYIPTIKWLYQKDLDPEALRGEVISTFLGVLRGTLFMILLFVSLTICTGITAGVARYEILRRFPQLLKRSEMVSLQLVDRRTED